MNTQQFAAKKFHMDYDKEPNLGTKAENLIRLAQAGFAVPDFFLVRQNHMAEDLKHLKDSFLKRGQRYAIRSSAALEDQSETAMAGLFETFLDVGVDQVASAVAKCFASAEGERVRAFARHKGIPFTNRMTVIVQEMITPELSGVLFTINPQGLTNEMMAVVGAGRGDQVVEDQIPVTTLIHHFHDDVNLIGSQESSPKLSDGLVQELNELSQKLKQSFPWPVDAEFSIQDGELWLLQARPITTLNLEEITVLDNSNISESYPGLTLPLTIDFARTAYSGIFQGLMARILGLSKTREIKPILNEMVAASSGRIYYQINNWYRIMKLLPFSRFYINIWQEMMGVRNRTIKGQGISLSVPERVAGILSLVKAIWHTPQEMIELKSHFFAYRQLFESELAKEPDREALIHLYEQMKHTLLERWDVTLLNDVQAFIFTTLLKRKLKKEQVNGNQVISSMGEVESLAPIRMLRRIAKVAPQEFLGLKDHKSVELYLSQAGAFQEIIRAYLNEFGDRYLEELKLESKTFRTDPILLVNVIKSLRQDPTDKSSNTTLSNQTTDLRANIPKANNQKTSQGSNPEATPWKDDSKVDLDPLLNLTMSQENSWADIRQSLVFRKAAQAIRNRETSRLDRARIFGMAREIFRRLGVDLAEHNRILKAEDVFWLKQEEVFSLEGDFRNIVGERKIAFQEFARLPMLSRLEFAGPVFDRMLPGDLSVERSEEPSLLGTGASPGIARGRILIVEDPSKIQAMPGTILVAKQTDPGWVFLIATAEGFIAEQGSLLSHTAIIARELGKPAVVGVRGATGFFKNDEVVEINGSTGQIRRIP